MSLNNRTELGRTKIVHDTDSPRWNETIYVIITSFSDALTIVPFDWNEYRKDKELGTAAFALSKLEEEEEVVEKELDAEDEAPEIVSREASLMTSATALTADQLPERRP